MDERQVSVALRPCHSRSDFDPAPDRAAPAPVQMIGFAEPAPSPLPHWVGFDDAAALPQWIGFDGPSPPRDGAAFAVAEAAPGWIGFDEPPPPPLPETGSDSEASAPAWSAAALSPAPLLYEFDKPADGEPIATPVVAEQPTAAT